MSGALGLCGVWGSAAAARGASVRRHALSEVLLLRVARLLGKVTFGYTGAPHGARKSCGCGGAARVERGSRRVAPPPARAHGLLSQTRDGGEYSDGGDTEMVGRWWGDGGDTEMVGSYSARRDHKPESARARARKSGKREQEPGSIRVQKKRRAARRQRTCGPPHTTRTRSACARTACKMQL